LTLSPPLPSEWALNRLFADALSELSTLNGQLAEEHPKVRVGTLRTRPAYLSATKSAEYALGAAVRVA
jgi:hypothetical protein